MVINIHTLKGNGRFEEEEEETAVMTQWQRIINIEHADIIGNDGNGSVNGCIGLVDITNNYTLTM